MWRKRIKAFTITELLVAMLLSSILLTMVWNVYHLAQRYYKNVELKSVKLIELKEIEYYITMDFKQANRFTKNDNTLHMIHTNDTIVYSFESNPITRNSKNHFHEFNFSGAYRLQLDNPVYISVNLYLDSLTTHFFSVKKNFSSEMLIKKDQPDQDEDF